MKGLWKVFAAWRANVLMTRAGWLLKRAKWWNRQAGRAERKDQ